MGVDCVGLVIQSLKNIGAPVQDVLGYRRRPDGLQLRREIEKQVSPADRTKPRAGDLLLFFHKRRLPVHVGVMTHGNFFYHSWWSVGRVTMTRYVEPWPSKLVRVYDVLKEFA